MPVSLAEMAAHLRRRQQQQQERARERAERLLALLPSAKATLAGRHGAARVWLFGSLARGDSSATSDVDLAVEGLASELYFPALAALMELFGGPVDLVRMEEASPTLAQRVRDEGREL